MHCSIGKRQRQSIAGYSRGLIFQRRIGRWWSNALKRSQANGCWMPGVDMASPEPVNQALRLFNELIGELEELI